MLSSDNFAAFDGIEIKAECLSVFNPNKDIWRFWCDDNGNGEFDQGEKFFEEQPNKSHFDIGPNGRQCQVNNKLQCGWPKETGSCVHNEERCTKELIIGQEPMIDWYNRETVNNFNWEIFITEPGYEGQLDAYCDGFDDRGQEQWVVYCDDNKDGKRNNSEEFVTFSTVLNYSYNGNDPDSYKVILKESNMGCGLTQCESHY